MNRRFKPAYAGLFVALAIALSGAAQSKLEGVAEDSCLDITAWLQAHPAGPEDYSDYRADLIRRGMTADQADARIKALLRVWMNCPSAVGLSFDRTYRNEKLPFNTEANAFLVEMTRDMKPGTALDVAMGQGRNSIYLAKAGWWVTGFDVSGEGIAAAQKTAEQAGVKIKAIRQGWQEFDFGTQKWDLIVLSYAWVPISNPEFVQRLCRSLRPGGFVLYEGHMADASTTPGVWPKPNELITLFHNELRILRYEDVETSSDWRRQGNTRVARLLARR
jgi:SAM-dependent methyltransferase